MSGIRECLVNVTLPCYSLIPGTSCLARQCSVSDILMALEGASAPCSGVVPPWNNAAIPASARLGQGHVFALAILSEYHLLSTIPRAPLPGMERGRHTRFAGSPP